MKYALAVVAIIVEFMVYSLICSEMNWKAGGGLLVQILMFAIFGATWRAITKKRNVEDTAANTQIEAEETTDQE